jgi:hypothetical protein
MFRRTSIGWSFRAKYDPVLQYSPRQVSVVVLHQFTYETAGISRPISLKGLSSDIIYIDVKN